MQLARALSAVRPVAARLPLLTSVRCAAMTRIPQRAYSFSACRLAATGNESNTTATPATSQRPTFTPSAADHFVSTNAGERPSATAPSTTATEQTDAESGLNEPVKTHAQRQAETKAREAVLKTPPIEPTAASAAASVPASGSGGSSGGDGGSKGGESDSAGERKSPIGPASWSSVTFLVLVGGAAVLYYRYQSDKQQNSVRIETIGTPLLGGPFALHDDSGAAVSSESLRGRYVLLYFGFTHCPDICPTELRKMEEALRQYTSMMPAHPIKPLFITIDPKRDTPARLREYKKAYSPDMQWLTGTDAEIGAVAKAYRVYFSAPDIAEGSDEEYLVDHSIFFYLLDRQGDFMEFFGKSKSAEEVALRMAQLIAQDNKAA